MRSGGMRIGGFEIRYGEDETGGYLRFMWHRYSNGKRQVVSSDTPVVSVSQPRAIKSSHTPESVAQYIARINDNPPKTVMGYIEAVEKLPKYKQREFYRIIGMDSDVAAIVWMFIFICAIMVTIIPAILTIGLFIIHGFSSAFVEKASALFEPAMRGMSVFLPLAYIYRTWVLPAIGRNRSFDLYRAERTWEKL